MGSPYKKLKIKGRTVYEHRVVMERKLGRSLRRDEHVHHKNERKRDNVDTNLEVKSPLDHARHHFAKNQVEKTCLVCGRSFRPPQPHRKRDATCGGSCRDVAIMATRLGWDRFAKLDPIRIRKEWASGRSARSLGREYGVTHRTILRVLAWPPPLGEAVARAVLAAMQERPVERTRRRRGAA